MLFNSDKIEVMLAVFVIGGLCCPSSGLTADVEQEITLVVPDCKEHGL